MNYKHFTISKCIRIDILSILNYSTRFITKFLHHYHSTIAQKLSHNKIENTNSSISDHNNQLKHHFKKSSSCSKYNKFLYISKNLNRS